MATIIAGGFETYVESQDAIKRLGEAGVNSEYLCEFRINPPGMHDATPVGGDRAESPGSLRPAEAMVAVNVEGAGIAEDEIIRVFEQAGAWQIERTDGRWENGEWKDFDPVAPPQLIGGRDPEAGAGRAASAQR